MVQHKLYFSYELGQKIWNCADCGYKQKLRKDVQKHIERRHLEIHLPCPVCQSTLSSRIELRTHIRQKHPGIQHQ